MYSYQSMVDLIVCFKKSFNSFSFYLIMFDFNPVVKIYCMKFFSPNIKIIHKNKNKFTKIESQVINLDRPLKAYPFEAGSAYLVYQFRRHSLASIDGASKPGYQSENMSNNSFHFSVNIIDLKFQLKIFLICHFFVQKLAEMLVSQCLFLENPIV